MICQLYSEYRRRELPLEALDDDLFNVHLCDQLPPVGQVQTLKDNSERVTGRTDFAVGTLRGCDIATMPPGRSF